MCCGGGNLKLTGTATAPALTIPSRTSGKRMSFSKMTRTRSNRSTPSEISPLATRLMRCSSSAYVIDRSPWMRATRCGSRDRPVSHSRARLDASSSNIFDSFICLQLEYKCEWYGRKLVKIDRFFPSSKRCNHCGFVMDKMPLDIRSWDCPSCKTTGIDRDINAGKNILAAGLAVIVCGADIRPDNHIVKGQLLKTPRGRKQKPKS